jgi:hypothetical protein
LSLNAPLQTFWNVNRWDSTFKRVFKL